VVAEAQRPGNFRLGTAAATTTVTLAIQVLALGLRFQLATLRHCFSLPRRPRSLCCVVLREPFSQGAEHFLSLSAVAFADPYAWAVDCDNWRRTVASAAATCNA
jgi:hypothetical protein